MAKYWCLDFQQGISWKTEDPQVAKKVMTWMIWGGPSWVPGVYPSGPECPPIWGESSEVAATWCRMARMEKGVPRDVFGGRLKPAISSFQTFCNMLWLQWLWLSMVSPITMTNYGLWMFMIRINILISGGHCRGIESELGAQHDITWFNSNYTWDQWLKWRI